MTFDDRTDNDYDPAPDERPAAADDRRDPRRRINPRSPRQALQPEAAPPPPQRSQKARHPLVVVLNFFVMIAVLTALAAGAAFYFGKAKFSAPGPLAEPASVVVARGTDLDSIAAQLRRHNVIDSDLIFTTAARIYKAGDQLKAGEYLFEPAVSMEQVLDDLVSGRSVLHAVAFPEGMTSRQIVDRLRADDTLTGDIAAVPAEGSLLPDTYKFTRGTTRQQILDQMARAQAKVLTEIWQRRSPDLPFETPAEFVTLASIVEKETGRADERPRVAAVFINRLRKKMRLQSDPTVIYGMFAGAGLPTGRGILQSDLDANNAFNTYRVAGLPPTPIANPGRAALEAVAAPSRTNELYFVADGSGGHAFAASLDQHNRNVARLRRIEAARATADQLTTPAAPVADAEPEAAPAAPVLPELPAPPPAPAQP